MQNCASAIFRISGIHSKFNKLSENWVPLIQFTRLSCKVLLATMYSIKQMNLYGYTMTRVWLYCFKILLYETCLYGEITIWAPCLESYKMLQKTGVFRTGLTSQSCKDIIWNIQNITKKLGWVGALRTNFIVTHVKILFEL